MERTEGLEFWFWALGLGFRGRETGGLISRIGLLDGSVYGLLEGLRLGLYAKRGLNNCNGDSWETEEELHSLRILRQRTQNLRKCCSLEIPGSKLHLPYLAVSLTATLATLVLGSCSSCRGLRKAAGGARHYDLLYGGFPK